MHYLRIMLKKQVHGNTQIVNVNRSRNKQPSDCGHCVNPYACEAFNA